MFSKPKLSRGPTTIPSQKQSKANRAKLTGPLIYGEEAMRGLRSMQPQPQPVRQAFRLNRINAAVRASVAQTATEITTTPKTPTVTTAKTKTTTAFAPASTKPAESHYSYVEQIQDYDPTDKTSTIGSVSGTYPSTEYPNYKNTNPPKRIPSPHETLEEFTQRISTLTANKYNLDPNLHDSIMELSLGQRPQNSVLDWGPQHRVEGPKTPKKPLSYEVQMAMEQNERFIANKPYETTFALREGRSSGEDSDSFQPSKRYWRNAMIQQKIRHQKQQGHHRSRKSLQSHAGSVRHTFRPSIAMTGKTEMRKSEGEKQEVSLKERIIQEGQAVLRRTSQILNESLKLRLKDEQKSTANEVNYVPLKVKGLKRNPKLTLLDRLEERRENIKNHGYTIAPDENPSDLNLGGIEGLNESLTGEKSVVLNVTKENRGHFGNQKLSSLVAKNVVASQGQKVHFSANDEMNPLERSMLEGLENYELSYFLKGPGQRNPVMKEPPRPIFKNDETKKYNLSSGKGHTSIVDSMKEESSSGGRGGIGESKVTKYLEELRLSGYPNLPTRSKLSGKRADMFNFADDDDGFDETILDNFKLTEERRTRFLNALKEKRVERIRTKAAMTGGPAAFAKMRQSEPYRSFIPL